MEDDRFSFATDDEAPMEVERGPNRLFLIIAIALIGFLFIGLLGVGGWFLLIKPGQERAINQQATQVAAESTAVAQQTIMAPTDTPVPTNTPLPTNTPAPTPTPPVTNTPVVRPTDTPDADATPTPTRTPIGGGQTPQTGIGGLGAVLAGAALLVVIFVARKMRLAA
jgi:cytoskeletal protein RodZ